MDGETVTLDDVITQRVTLEGDVLMLRYGDAPETYPFHRRTTVD